MTEKIVFMSEKSFVVCEMEWNTESEVNPSLYSRTQKRQLI